MTTDNGVDREIEDLEQLAVTAYLTGRDADSDDAWARAFQECVRRDVPVRAARCAFWLAFRLLNAGDQARAGGWIARAQRVLDGSDEDCVERGYLLYLAALRTIFAGDAASASTGFEQAVKSADRFADPDLATLGRAGQGRSLVYLSETAEGMALLDEAMVAVTTGEVSPIVAGDTYCTMIETCQELFDLRRAQIWTAELSRWCETQPDLVPYRGQCLIHRAEILQLGGAWQEAIEEARRALQRLSHPTNQPAVAAAHYQFAELHRLRGEFAPAGQAYHRASELGRDPQPGLALLHLAQGRLDPAVVAIRRAMDEADDRLTRSKLLPAYTEIMLAANDNQVARDAAEELIQLTTSLDAPMLRAVADHAMGAVLLAEGAGRAGLVALRRAAKVWHELDAPYEAARVRVLVARACHALGDDHTASLELQAARGTFVQLGARSDLARLDSCVRPVTPPATPDESAGLTPRELQVLRLLARGETNKAIAAELAVSGRTVDRHVSNIFTKLGVSSRSAATAYAHRNQLV